MKQTKLFLILALLMAGSAVFAQTDAEKATKAALEAKEKATKAAMEAQEKAAIGWKKGGSLGLDMSGLGLVNPRLGAGSNRFGFGGLLNLFAANKGEKTFWDNNFSMLLSSVRIGGKDNPFQKNSDILRLNSRYGYNIIKNKLYFAVDGAAESQLLPTYTGNLLDGPDENLLAEFLAPLRLGLAPGLDFRPNSHLKFFFSPIGLNFIYVGNDALAQLAGQPLGNEINKNNRTQLGYLAKAEYNNKFLSDRIGFLSRVGWFADYTQSLNGNVLWQNSVDFQIFKGLSLNIFGDLFYDHFSKAIVKEIPEGTAPTALEPFLGLNSSYTGGFLIKYNRLF